ncbi:autoinducer 2 ABC transporter substrate-binding protein [Neobacillus niacini]|uniref:autoinducer 2 ABC transporter substrate-binding protein n=1 Tax=Neobacillus niacini TaxID=86668 RepID=UPI00203A76C4|nr:autoinducer 2 ABC transporter substrate-binding protein [Neobacillus niacini]MCM3693915.1 autoinducer 2 ABC transporter substrate-binding protein [Neobacillus niacini]
MFRIIIILFIVMISTGCSTKAQYEVVYSNDNQLSLEEEKKEYLDSYKIGIVSKIRGISYFNAVQEGVIEAADDLGVEVIFRGPSDATWEGQEKIIEELIKSEVDVIAIAANDPKKLSPILQKAQNQGIKVITWDSDTDPEFREFYINMLDPETLGRHLMDSLALGTNESGNYIILTGSESSANLNDWIKWIKIQNEKYYPNLKLLEIIATDENYEKAHSTSIKIIEKYPDLAGIVAISTVNPSASAEAVKNLKKEGEIVIIGTTTPNLIREHIKDGTVQVNTLWSPQKLGYLTVSLAKDLLDKKLPYDGQVISKVGAIKVNADMVIMGLPIDFTKENIDEYDF